MEEKVIKEGKKSVFAKKEVWISGIIGLLLGAAIIILLYVIGVPGFGNETIATVKGKSIKKNDIYNEIKKANSVNYALDVVDSAILKNKYKLTSDQEKEIQDQADYYISTYQTYYGYEEEEFLKENGFESKEDFDAYEQSILIVQTKSKGAKSLIFQNPEECKKTVLQIKELHPQFKA